jgi:ribonuclease P/MRP protein subunit RPP40
MLDIHRPDSAPDTKIYFSHSVLPTYIDPQNVSTKKKPFSAFNAQKYSHTVSLILPSEIYSLIAHQLHRADSPARAHYARVHMKLSEILEAEFLTTYVKQSNIMMLSEGRPLVDDRFELSNGTLRMELTRPTYERCGLQGTPVEDGGRKHQKQRWVVEYDLRASSMKHGKKGFGRLEWACRNVLDRSLTWLFWNANPSSKEALGEGREPLSKHAPWVHGVLPEETKMDNVLVPRLSVAGLKDLYAEEDALGLLEWIHMLELASPRVEVGDDINPHLSRYEVPDLGRGVGARDMVVVRWRGFMTPAFARDLFLMVKREGFKSGKKVNGTQDADADVDMEGGNAVEGEEGDWFAMSAQAFGGKNSWTVMQFEGRETLVWEMES